MRHPLSNNETASGSKSSLTSNEGSDPILGEMEPYLIDGLSNKTEDEQDNIVKFCIKQSRKSKALCRSHEEYVAKLQDERLIEKNQKKDSRF